MAEKEEEKQEGEAKKSKMPLIIVGVVLVVVIIIAVVLFTMLGGHGDEEAAAEGAPASKEHAADKKKKVSHGEAEKIGPIFALDTLVVNLISEGGSRFVKVGVGLEMDAQELGPEIGLKKAVFTDIVIGVFSAKTAEEITTAKGKENAKQEIMDKINERLSDGRVKNIYFTNFIIQ